MDKPTIAILGGTGPEGAGLALRWGAAGYPIIIGSRDATRAAATGHDLREKIPGSNITGLVNLEATETADIVVLSVPFSGQAATLADVTPALAGKILITAVVPLDPQAKRRAPNWPDGPAAVQAQKQVGEGVKVVAAFQNVGAHQLMDAEAEVDCDVLVCGDDRAAKDQVIALAEAGGMRAWDAGPLANALVVEGMTALLININIRHKSKGAGIRITNVGA